MKPIHLLRLYLLPLIVLHAFTEGPTPIIAFAVTLTIVLLLTKRIQTM